MPNRITPTACVKKFTVKSMPDVITKMAIMSPSIAVRAVRDTSLESQLRNIMTIHTRNTA